MKNITEQTTWNIVIAFVLIIGIGLFLLAMRNDKIRADLMKDCYQTTDLQVICPVEEIKN